MSSQKATFASGCFWCGEALFRQVKGVSEVISGYTGGHTKQPTYEQVCNGTTGHAEAIQITFDPAIVPFEQLVKLFFVTHDPTTMNRQGHDVGTQYRSAIFFHDEAQQATAERVKSTFEAQHLFASPIVTAIIPAPEWYPAEEYHQHYFERNPDQPYCQAIIAPKVAKLRKEFFELLAE